MLKRFAFFLLLALGNGVAFGQLPANRLSPINTLNRYHGFGISDGYHECRQTRDSIQGIHSYLPWNQLKSVSSFYGLPTSPPGPSIQLPRRNYPTPVARSAFDVPSCENFTSFAPLFSAPSTIESTPVLDGFFSDTPPGAHPMIAAPNQPAPQFGNIRPEQFRPSQLQYSNQVPMQMSPSPSDQRPPAIQPPIIREQLPKPSKEPSQPAEAISPLSQLKRIPPGTKSWMQPAAFRLP